MFQRIIKLLKDCLSIVEMDPIQYKEAAEFVEALHTDTYVLVPWPEVQELMGCSWFQEEAVLHPEKSSEYFIPLHRIYEND